MQTLFETLKEEVFNFFEGKVHEMNEPEFDLEVSVPFKKMIKQMIEDETSKSVTYPEDIPSNSISSLRIPFLATFHIKTNKDITGYNLKLRTKINMQTEIPINSKLHLMSVALDIAKTIRPDDEEMDVRVLRIYESLISKIKE